MKHLIIALVLSLTASFSMACDKAPQMLTENKQGAYTKEDKLRAQLSSDNMYDRLSAHQQLNTAKQQK